jgi:hypothetical protein
MVLTTDYKTFRGELRPGDVLLFDTLHGVSAAIKAAENRPVNHCALYMGCGRFLHASGHSGAQSALGPSTIEDRLCGRLDRTITAMRHTAASRAGAAWATARALAMHEKHADYAYLNLATLAAPCFCRAYLRDGSGQLRGWGRRGASSLLWLSTAAMDMLAEQAEREDFAADAGGRETLTCSEFVYVCLHSGEGEHRVSVPNNLAWWHVDLRSRRDEPALGLASVRDDDEGEIEYALGFHPALGEASLDSGPPLRTASISSDERLREAGRKLVARLFNYGLGFGKYNAAQHAPDALFASEVVLRDVVTPGDLWSSPSLNPIAVLHRPPGEGDAEIDGPLPPEPPASTPGAH